MTTALPLARQPGQTPLSGSRSSKHELPEKDAAAAAASPAGDAELEITAMTWCGDGVIAIGGSDGSVSTWKVRPDYTCELLAAGRAAAQHTGHVLALAWNAERGLLLSGGDDASAKVWDVPPAALGEDDDADSDATDNSVRYDTALDSNAEQPTAAPAMPSPALTCVATLMSLGTALIRTAAPSRTKRAARKFPGKFSYPALLWDDNSDALTLETSQYGACVVTRWRFVKDGGVGTTQFCSRSWDGTSTWQAVKWQIAHPRAGHSMALYRGSDSVKPSLAVGTSDGRVVVLKADTLRPVYTSADVHSFGVAGLAWGLDGSCVISGAADSQVLATPVRTTAAPGWLMIFLALVLLVICLLVLDAQFGVPQLTPAKAAVSRMLGGLGVEL